MLNMSASRGIDNCYITGSFYNSSLQAGSVCDLEQRVYVVQVNLPKPEDLDRIGM